MDLGFRTLALTAFLSLSFSLSSAASAQTQPQQTPADQQAVPDAPAPQAASPLTGFGPLKPGIGTPPSASTSSTSTDVPQQTPATPPPTSQTNEVQKAAPDSMNPEDIGKTIVVNTTYVEVPVTVKDTKGKPISGLTWRDFRVYENNTWEPLKIFTVDPAALSIAFVIDQSLTSDLMAKEND